MGLIEYYSKFVKNVSDKTACLRGLLKKGVSFVWNAQHQECFNNIKKEICEANVLSPFDMNCKSILTVDASATGLGAMLSQCRTGSERTVAFASRTLTDAERNYSVIEREALAASRAVEFFRTYL